MSSDWPDGLDLFGKFLVSQGLSFELRGIVPHTGDKLWQYGSAKIGVRVVADRGDVWGVFIADIPGWPQQWYHANELRELLTGKDRLSASRDREEEELKEDMGFVETHWSEIVQALAEDKRERTHERLKVIAEEQNRRRYNRASPINEIFRGYFGHPDFHDSEIVNIHSEGSAVEVTLRSEQGSRYVVSFSNAAVSSRDPIGMRLYAISRMEEQNSSVKYVFVNWDEQNDSALNITTDIEPAVWKIQ